MTEEIDGSKDPNDSIVIRVATLDDAPSIATIYRHYVEISAAGDDIGRG